MAAAALHIPLTFQLSCLSFFNISPKGSVFTLNSSVFYSLSAWFKTLCNQFLVFSNTNHLQFNKKGTKRERTRTKSREKEGQRGHNLHFFFLWTENKEWLGRLPHLPDWQWNSCIIPIHTGTAWKLTQHVETCPAINTVFKNMYRCVYRQNTVPALFHIAIQLSVFHFYPRSCLHLRKVNSPQSFVILRYWIIPTTPTRTQRNRWSNTAAGLCVSF